MTPNPLPPPLLFSCYYRGRRFRHSYMNTAPLIAGMPFSTPVSATDPLSPRTDGKAVDREVVLHWGLTLRHSCSFSADLLEMQSPLTVIIRDTHFYASVVAIQLMAARFEACSVEDAMTVIDLRGLRPDILSPGTMFESDLYYCPRRC